MGFASRWLESGAVFPALTGEAPPKNTGIIIVVPSYNEASVQQLLFSLGACNKPECHVEVIIIFNAPDGASGDVINRNRSALSQAALWNSNNKPFFSLHLADVGCPSIKDWGVGLARKAGMDEALRRFDAIDREDGLIVCLDADCTVDSDYLTELENSFLKIRERKACSIYFEHRLDGKEQDEDVIPAIIQYELHLRYLLQGLRFTGYPWVFHTVGSTIAVRAIAYMKAGGMNRRRAGEDFYFVQKLVPAGGFFSLTSTTVHPSPRVSDRVPFGTGAAIGKMINSNNKTLLTYNPRAFPDLKNFFETSLAAYSAGSDDLKTIYSQLPVPVKDVVQLNQWESKMQEIRDNTSGFRQFRKRFHEWFNMFRMIKFLNSSHRNYYEKIPVGLASAGLLEMMNQEIAGNEMDLLLHFRALEKAGG